MKKNLTYLICILLFIDCTNSEKKTSNEVTDEDIYKIVKMVLNDMSPQQKLDGTDDWYILNELQTPSFVDENPSFDLGKYFSKDDIIFINHQISKRKVFTLQQDSLKSKKLLSKKIIDSFYDKNAKNRRNTFFENYTRKYGNNFYHSFSLPVFSKDKKTILIDVSSFLGGGQTILFKNINGHWKSEAVISWVS